jgi:deoxyadenosine/deoxycytidine kinase
MYKIGLTSTMSCGKTTLIKALQQHPQFKDYYIATERSKYLRDLGIRLNTDSTLLGQTIFAAERSSELMRENLLTDRTIIDVIAFTNSANSIPYYMAHDFEKLYSNLIAEYDFIFYISPNGMSIEDNGVRETNADYRMKIDTEIQGLLRKYSHKIKNLYTIEGMTVEERVNFIVDKCFPKK